jgi:hypothetical protein
MVGLSQGDQIPLSVPPDMFHVRTFVSFNSGKPLSCNATHKLVISP